MEGEHSYGISKTEATASKDKRKVSIIISVHSLHFFVDYFFGNHLQKVFGLRLPFVSSFSISDLGNAGSLPEPKSSMLAPTVATLPLWRSHWDFWLVLRKSSLAGLVFPQTALVWSLGTPHLNSSSNHKSHVTLFKKASLTIPSFCSSGVGF